MLIHTLIHISYTSFVDSANEEGKVRLSCCLSYRGIQGWRCRNAWLCKVFLRWPLL